MPLGAEGAQGPALGAGDDIARVAAAELDPIRSEPPPKLTPRKAIPWLSIVPLRLSIALCALVGWQVVRVSASHPDRAVLARVVGGAVMIALLSTAGELVEAQYLARQAAPTAVRLQRALVGFVALAVLLFVYAFTSRSHP